MFERLIKKIKRNIFDDNEYLCKFTYGKEKFPIFSQSFLRYMSNVVEMSYLLSQPKLYDQDETIKNRYYDADVEVPREIYFELSTYKENEFKLFHEYVKSTDNILCTVNLFDNQLFFQNDYIKIPWVDGRYKKNGKYYVHISGDRILYATF